MRAEPVGAQSARDFIARLSRRDDQQYESARDGAEHLGHDVRKHFVGRMSATGPQAQGDRRIQVTARDVADRVSHRKHGQAERQRYAGQADPDVDPVLQEDASEHGAAAAAEYEPESADELGREFPGHGHEGFPA